MTGDELPAYLIGMNLLRRRFAYRYYNAAAILVGINAAVFFLFSRYNGYLALNVHNVLVAGAWWQFLSYMYAHANLNHLLVNMIGLFLFGNALERRIGSTEFLVMYHVVGLLAGVFSFFIYLAGGGANVYLLGASGAIFGVLLAYATYFPDSRVLLFFVIPLKATHMVIGYTAIELLSQFAARNSNVAHLTHLAGFAFAFLYLYLRLGVNPIESFRGGNRGPHVYR